MLCLKAAAKRACSTSTPMPFPFQMRTGCLVAAVLLLCPAVLGIPLLDAAAVSAISTLGWGSSGHLRHVTEAASHDLSQNAAHDEPSRALPTAPPPTHITSEGDLAPTPPISVMEHALVAVACDATIPHVAGAAPSLILIGGSDLSGTALSSVLSLDIASRQWRPLQPMPQPRQAALAVLSQSWGGVVVCGGR